MRLEEFRKQSFQKLRSQAELGNELKGLSQRELAELLDVHESQVSRDEKNEYHNVTLERANRILEVLGVELRSVVKTPEDVLV